MRDESPVPRRYATAKADLVFHRFLLKMTGEDLNRITLTHAKANLISHSQAVQHRDEFLELLAMSNITDRVLPRSDNVIAFWYSFMTHAQEYDDAMKLHSDNDTNKRRSFIAAILDRLNVAFSKKKGLIQNSKESFTEL